MLAKMLVRNRMSVDPVNGRVGDVLQFIKNPNTGKVFFLCGTKRGYVSPAVQQDINTVKGSDLQYAECCIEGNNEWVPCIMKKSSENVLRTL